ncbi:MAG: hypothetical protein HUJ26_20940 [Planctomycetaceae bacterium]|nr:hypothetical protein [Planctomycetaceae bacterium]
MLCSYFRLPAFLILCFALAGCSGSDDASSSGNGPDSESSAAAGTESLADQEERQDGFEFELDRSAENVAGGWILCLTQEQNEIPVAMVGVVARDQKNPSMENLKVVILQPTKAGGKLEAGPSTVTEQTVQFQFSRDGQFQLFAGQLKEGIIFGNILNAEGRCFPARMVRPTKQLQSEPQPSLAEGFFELTDILKEGGDWDQLVTFIEEHPESPLTINAIYSLTSQVVPRDADLDQIKVVFELIDKTLEPWGNRLKQYSRLNTLVAMASVFRHADYLESVRTSLEGEFTEPMWEEQHQFVLDNMEEEIKTIQTVEELRASSPDNRAEIIDQLEEIRQDNLFNFNFMRATAEALQEVGDDEAALEWYLDYVSIPGLDSFYLNQFQMYAAEVTPTSQQLTELWEETGHTEEELSKAIEDNYLEFLSSYEFPELTIPEDNQKQVLVELFTSTACLPCIASDIAFSRLKQQLPAERVTFLQYHLHVPAADPLTVEGSVGRFHYYGAGGTPAYFVDGRSVEGTSGPASVAETTIIRLADEIVEELKIPPTLDLKAKVTPEGEGVASFEAHVDAKEINERWRLNVVLAEEIVHYRGPNQVPFHEMVVRHVYTPSQGEPPKGASLSYAGKIDLDEIRASINADLEKLRTERSVNIPDAPLEMKNLHLVVFVQDTRNLRVRQSISVPVPDLSSPKVSSAD